MVLQFRNGSIPRVHAIADIKVDQHNKWNAVSIDLLINRLRTIVILLPPISEREGGNDPFRAKPIRDKFIPSWTKMGSTLPRYLLFKYTLSIKTKKVLGSEYEERFISYFGGLTTKKDVRWKKVGRYRLFWKTK